jgi:osmotically-inducible protein OsmY
VALAGALQLEKLTMKSDAELKRDVEAELKWAPDVNETDIAIKVNGGVVALSGFTHSYYERMKAETAVKRVAGVAGVANDLEVRIPSTDRVPDPEIAREVVTAIRSELPFIADKIKVLVRDASVTLEGNVEWQFQREEAEKAARRQKGVRIVGNQIQLVPRVSAADVKHKIEDAFRRSAEVDARGVIVEADGSEVILRGKVRSWAERDEAQRTAWSAPGVMRVRNEISVNI